MDRRRFLRWLGGTAAGVAASHVLDVERLLWVPGERTIFLPAVEPYEVVIEVGPSFNHLVTPDWIMREALRVIERHLTVTTVAVNRRFDATCAPGADLLVCTGTGARVRG